MQKKLKKKMKLEITVVHGCAALGKMVVSVKKNEKQKNMFGQWTVILIFLRSDSGYRYEF